MLQKKIFLKDFKHYNFWEISVHKRDASIKNLITTLLIIVNLNTVFTYNF